MKRRVFILLLLIMLSVGVKAETSFSDTDVIDLINVDLIQILATYDLGDIGIVNKVIWYEDDMPSLFVASTVGLFQLEFSDDELTSIERFADPVFDVALNASPNVLAFTDGRMIHLLELDTGDYLSPLEHRFSLALAFSADGNLLSSGDSSGLIHIWEAENYEELFTLIAEDDNAVDDLEFSADASILASSHQRGGVHLWTLADNSPELTILPGNNSLTITFSPDNHTLASGMWSSAESTLQVWNFDNETMTFLAGHDQQTNTVDYGTSNDLLVSGGNDGLIKIWDVNFLQQIRTLEGHVDNVISVQFNQEGNLIASVDSSNGLIIWGVPSE